MEIELQHTRLDTFHQLITISRQLIGHSWCAWCPTVVLPTGGTAKRGSQWRWTETWKEKLRRAEDFGRWSSRSDADLKRHSGRRGFLRVRTRWRQSAISRRGSHECWYKNKCFILYVDCKKFISHSIWGGHSLFSHFSVSRHPLIESRWRTWPRRSWTVWWKSQRSEIEKTQTASPSQHCLLLGRLHPNPVPR